MTLIHAETGRLVVETGRSEADLRDAIADYGQLHGWRVQKEVVIPGWGRIDVLFDTPQAEVVVELKRQLTTASAARRAFQQADGYRCHLARVDPRPTRQVVLSAVDIDQAACSAASKAYRDVTLLSLGGVMGLLILQPESAAWRRSEVEASSEWCQERARQYRAAATHMDDKLGEPDPEPAWFPGASASDIRRELEAVA